MQPTSVVPRLWPHLLLAAVCGTLVTLSGIHRFQNADSLLPVLVSLQHWTFFYWEQNRYGMLVPLLAAPFQHPLTNLLFETGLTAFGGVAAIYLAARYLYRNSSWPLVGSVATTALFLVAPAKFLWMYLSTWEPVAPALPLGLAALLLVVPGEGKRWPSPRRWATAVVCILLAAWVHAAIGFFLFPLAVTSGLVRWLSDRQPGTWRQYLHEMAAAAAVCGIGTVSALIAQELSPYQTISVTILPPSEVRLRISKAVAEMWAVIVPFEWVGLLVGCLGAASTYLAIRPLRSTALRSLGMVFAAFVTLVVFAVVMSIAAMGYWRYALPSMIVLHLTVIAAAVRPVVLGYEPRKMRILGCLLAVVVLISIPVSLGLPSVSVVRNDLEALAGRPEGVPLPPGRENEWKPTLETGRRADAIVEARCTHVAGTHWVAGPVVFLANLKNADRGEPGTVWGLGIRAGANAERWKAVPREQVRVGVLPPERDMNGELRGFGYPFKFAEPIGPIRVFVPVEP